MNSKRKGNTGERELLKILSSHGEAKRNDQTFVGGSGNPDILFSIGGHQLHVEAKRTERLNLHAAIKQAETDAAKGTIPAVVHRRNREAWYLTMKLDNFFDVMEGK